MAPWRNGGGITHEIASVSDDCGLLWRLSLAEIDRTGPFSDFPGLHRILTVVAGGGLVLDLPDGPRRATRLCPVAFDGAVPVAARLTQGAVRALNLMCRKDVIASVATLSGRVRHLVAAGPGETFAIHIGSGGAIGNGAALEPGTPCFAPSVEPVRSGPAGFADGPQTLGMNLRRPSISASCWSGDDTKGNLANPCCQYIYVYRNSLSTIEFPLNYDGLPGNHPTLSCHIFGDSIPPVEPTGLPGSNFCANAQIAPPVDVIIDLCEKSYKIIRTHKVIEWCTGRVLIHNQIIKVLDDEGPDLDCPKNVTISTDDYTCSATYKVPRPVVSNECSEKLTYHLSYNSVGIDDPDYISTNVNQVTGTITGLPIGFNWIQWTVTDDCGNFSTCRFRVTVEDRVRPVPVCDQFTVASITGNGKAIVDAFTFDDGSTDNCGILKFEARKMTDLCNFGTSLFTPFVEFCCEEVNTSVMVEMRVTDVHGNSNTCMVEVRVQDKLQPYITRCPADITLDCQADYCGG